MIPVNRIRPDRCPGALRPWPADDGLLVRLRLPGGRLRGEQLSALLHVAEQYGDGRVHVTSRTNLQVRGMPADPGTEQLTDEVLLAIEGTGLLPSRAHDLARNIMASPQTGLAGGRADLRPVIRALDVGLCSDADLAHLPGRFLLVLDDGRGDLVERSCDLGLVALCAESVQLRIGKGWGPVVLLEGVHHHLLELARRFLTLRPAGPEAPWHVSELTTTLLPPHQAAAGLPAPVPALPYGRVPGGHHVPVPPEGLDRPAVERLRTAAPELVVTPWRGVLIPEETR
ncbi:nitrite reductase [Nocardioides gilvus]|uniref:nitrite reductase n=1 Tax=Nocardioides gilvus TaxID=1735589 RepID=UPI000D74BEFF|nr:nitrite reductase [Nocardioides gilvus]